MRVLTACLVAINVATFALYGLDKYRAKHGMWRISENILLGLAWLGGGLGAALSMGLFRHKTRKTRFRVSIPLAVLLWVCLLWLLGSGMGRDMLNWFG